MGEFEQMPLGGEKAKEGIKERGFACKVLELELCPLRKYRIKTGRNLNVEELQVTKSSHYAKYLREVKFLLRTQPIEGERQRSDEANIIDRILRSIEGVFDAARTESGGDLRLVQR